jgi:2-polyprenyl-6-methoxyphenol hydroxylase-like FAD-dependent oxidoreductase
MASIRRLDPSLHKAIYANGFPTPKTVMKSARGWILGVMPFNDLRGEHPECCVMILREVVIGLMYDRIPQSAVVRQKVVTVDDGNDQATVHLDNGESHSYDLVIGADGVWSKTRLAILGDKVKPEYKYDRPIL